MTDRERMLAVLEEATAELCDDCITERVGWPRRQRANMVGRRLEKEGLVGRKSGLCVGCSKEKILNVLSDHDPQGPRDPRATHGQSDAAVSSVRTPHTEQDGQQAVSSWHWEGYVQDAVATYLHEQGYALKQVMNTASKEAGVDIIAEKDRRELWVTVKGYPEGTARTNSHTQSRHGFSSAMFDVVRYRSEEPEIDIAVALPDGFTTYLNLAKRVGWLKTNAPFRFFWVAEDGTVREE